MRVLVAGAGSVGTFVGGALARGGENVTLLGRGANVRAIAERGLYVRGTADSFQVRVTTTECVAPDASFDVTLVAVKAHQLAAIAPLLGALARAGSTIVPMQNGVPFWFFDGFDGPLAGAHLASVDPAGTLAASIGTDAVVGCVVNAGTRIPQPGVVEQVAEPAYVFGEPDGAMTTRVRKIVAVFENAGLEAVVEGNIRRAIWSKLITNVAVNPVSALTRASAQQMAEDPGVARILADIMEEQTASGHALGFDVEGPPAARLRVTRRYGDQRTSMLQDVEVGRPLELEPIVGAAIEVADLVRVPVPVTRRIYALARLLDAGTRRRGHERGGTCEEPRSS